MVLEKHARAHVLARVRAGVLEPTTMDVLRANGLSERMDRTGQLHDGMRIVWAGRDSYFIDVARHVGKQLMTYGQTSIQEDLFAAADRRDATVLTEVTDVRPIDVNSDRPQVRFVHAGREIAARMRLHRRMRRLPRRVARGDPERRRGGNLKRFIPLAGWAYSRARRHSPDITYANHPRGFALASARNANLSRYYIQVPLDTKIEDWPDERFWAELKAAFRARSPKPSSPARRSRNRSTPLRSFVAEPMRYGRLFLAGDAAHIVPPTGAKGLNLAVSTCTTCRARSLPTTARFLDSARPATATWRCAGYGVRCAFPGI